MTQNHKATVKLLKKNKKQKRFLTFFTVKAQMLRRSCVKEPMSFVQGLKSVLWVKCWSCTLWREAVRNKFWFLCGAWVILTVFSCSLGGPLAPQTIARHDLHPISAHLHICSDLQPPAPLLLGAHLFVRLSGWRSDRSLSGLHLPRSGPPQQCIQGSHRQPFVSPTAANTNLFSSTRRPSLPLRLSAFCLVSTDNAAPFPV